jgi:DNA-binding XRE family transcriptional regulator
MWYFLALFDVTTSFGAEMDNNLRKLRQAADMSPAQLAALVGASALDIHRIEMNRMLAPVNVALGVSEALGKPVEAVFPDTSEVLSQFKNELKGPGFPSNETFRRLREAGLEGDIRQRSLTVLLRGHKATMSFPIEPRDADRLFSVVQKEQTESAEFICFDSAGLYVAINLARIVYIHFLWEAPFVIIVPADKEDEDDNPAEVVRVFVDEDDDPIILRVEPENGADFEDEQNYLNNALLDLDSGFKEPHERVHIVDDAGESAFFRVGDIALMTAPLWMLYSDELDLRDEDGNLPDE